MPANSPHSRFVVETLERPDTLAYINVDRQDGYIVGGPAFALLLLGTILGLGVGGFLLAFVGMFIGGTIVWASPDQMNGFQWVKTLWYYKTQPEQVDSEEEAAVEANDGLMGYFVTDEDTQEFTNIERWYPDFHVIKRTDGALVGGYKLEPGNMGFVSPRKRARIRQTIAEWANNNGRFPFQLYVTSTSYPVEDYGENLKDRLQSEDLENAPVQQAVLQSEIENRPRGLNETGQGMREYYLITHVDTSDIIKSQTGEKTPLEKLTEVPFIGIIFQGIAHQKEVSDTLERDRKMMQTLRERLDTIDTQLIDQVPSWSGEPLEVEEWVELQHRFWTGQEPQYADVSDHISDQAHVEARPHEEGELDPDMEETA